MNRASAAVVLPLRFAWAMCTSGVQTIAVILRSRPRVGMPVPASFVRMRFAPMSEQGAALLAAMISLTPGTTVVEIDMTARHMVLHMLDASDAAAAIAGIRRRFERPLLAWFAQPTR